MGEDASERTTHVIAVANQKGGVGKTTNTINIAAALGELGNESLIIDLDMTAGATKALGTPTSGWLSTYELLTHAETAEECIIDDKDEEVELPPHLDLIPSSRRLNELDAWLAHPDNRWVQPLDLLLEPIQRLRGRYDFIFLDTPPQVTKTSLPAFKAADFVILSATPDTLAIEGLSDALKDIASARKVGNADLGLLGVVLCAIPKPKTKLAQQLIRYVDTHVTRPDGSTLKFETGISRTVVLQEAQRMKTSIFGYEPSHAVSEQYRALAREVVARIASFSQATLTPAAPPPAAEERGAAEPGEVANA